jgi:hypothetical protein
MKDKEPESYIEKSRTYRDRKKRRRLPADEVVAEVPKPLHVPYKRTKNWVNQTDEE